MQVFSQDMELSCIKTLTSVKIPEKVRSTLLGKLNADYFYYPPTVAAFERISIVAKERFEIMSFVDLVEHPAMSEDFRDILKDADDVRPAKSKKAIARMVDSLDDYRKIRIVVDTASKALDQLESDSVDIDDLLNKITDKITKARRNIGQDDKFISIGGKNNKHADEVVHNVLNKLVEPMVKTGFTDYDSRNGGLPEEGVVLLAATTSGGKTAVLMNLMVNLYLQSNKRVCRISLEMGDMQEMQRVLSRISGVAFWKIKQGKMSPKEKQRVKKAYKKFKNHGKNNSAEFTTICPTRNMTIDDALRMIKPYGFDIIGIDYVGLLDGVNDDNQWKVLSSIVRDCKIFSRECKCLVIVLCQLDDESDKLRYSKGMKEHADVMFSWNYSKKEQRELKILPITVDKARDGELFGFQLGERFEVMTVDNMSGDSYSSDDDDDDITLSDKNSDDNDGDDVEDYALA